MPRSGSRNQDRMVGNSRAHALCEGVSFARRPSKKKRDEMMAYVNFAETAPALVFHSLQGRKAETAAQFDALELSVVALARRDSLRSLRTPGRIAKAMAVLFGSTSENPIADPRLEALRRMAVHGWHRGFAVPASEILRFTAAGFSADQLELLLTSIGRARAARRV
jgi:hypothetical protein